ncbi:hypothetical protein F3Y22_tig00111402pilonHSYRG00374 [Hibiscus syriacus]|uniref:Zinc finger CCCH domain-containing protein 53-like n=1 Tax=Hibiscus syriacus TaxID=106335 RepID=A0A6A2Y9E0_HIBSY|nr:zinc finger CCCH domain-containing protein 53-like [Hibiscus syriacus]KAE8678855.1 hypothetical protein F3Y22_tig00111402pilonHSYRG00374 [Hibiscus syriacus]
MESYDATRMVFSRIQNLDPENASKIMGYLLIQDHGEKEMIRLAFGPEALIHSLILKAKTHLGLSISNPPTPSTPSSPSPFSSRPSPLSIPSNASKGLENHSLSHASIVNGSTSNISSNEFVDDYQFQDGLSFLNDSKPEDLFDPRLDLASMASPTGCYADSPLHRRSFSVPGLCLGAEDLNSRLGFKPCLYFARGFCKNGSSCRFIHGDHCAESATNMTELEQCQELLRSKSLQQQQQKLAASSSQFLPGGASFPYNKCVNYLLQQQQNETHRSAAAAAALMMGDELHKYGQCRPEMGANPSSRQIYLTFPADSTFKEEDVSNYFSIYGPVQDVRIPYQQKRMFGFVTFVYPETVKLILAKGNPHFVCDSRVLVKPYKEKGKVQEKKQQQLERGEYSACSSPTLVDSREPFDLHLRTRMFYNTPEMLLQRKLEEQADLQQAIELQGRRLMNLQMLDFKNHRQSPFHHDLSTGSPIPSPTVFRTPTNQARIFPSDVFDQETHEDNAGNLIGAVSKLTAATDADKPHEEVNLSCNHKNENGNAINKERANVEENDFPESLEHILPDNLFASPKKLTGDHLTVFTTSSIEADDKTGSPTASSNGNPLLANASGLNVASLKSCFLQLPRFSSGQGAIEM